MGWLVREMRPDDEPFYSSLGFRSVTEMYIEDGIAHVDMVRAAA